MQTRYENENNLQYLNEAPEQDREISLGTTTILGIFFALALLCAVFFGFGYSMGRRSAALPPANNAEVTASQEKSTSKPSPGAPVDTRAGKSSDPATQSAIVPLDPPVQDSQPEPSHESVRAVALPSHTDPHPAPSANPAAKPSEAVPVSTTAPSAGSLVVQVAAMSHQEDADVVAIDLKRRGYSVAIRHESQDRFFHVQIGPFSTKKEADTMRQRLQTDGYNNAIVK